MPSLRFLGSVWLDRRALVPVTCLFLCIFSSLCLHSLVGVKGRRQCFHVRVSFLPGAVVPQRVWTIHLTCLLVVSVQTRGSSVCLSVCLFVFVLVCVEFCSCVCVCLPLQLCVSGHVCEWVLVCKSQVCVGVLCLFCMCFSVSVLVRVGSCIYIVVLLDLLECTSFCCYVYVRVCTNAVFLCGCFLCVFV